MRLRLGRPRCALVVAPHPDDEAIGAFGLIAMLRRRGCAVRILVVTDGAGSHRHSPTWPTARLVAERRRETRRAMARLGVMADRIAFLGLPDGRIGEDRAHRIAIIRAIAHARPLDLLVASATDDAHPDHRAVADAVGRARLSGVRRLAYPIWPTGRRRPARERRLPLHALRHRKRAAIRGYRTQTGAIADDPQGFAIAPHELRAFARPAEMFGEVRR